MLYIYDIAGLKVAMNDPIGRTEKQARAYLAQNQSPDQHIDIHINITEERLKTVEQEHPELNESDWYYMLSGFDFYVGLLDYNGILLQSSCVVVYDWAYAFSADSGTGKSTHTQLWLKKFGERAYMLNDDKPAIRMIDGKIYACGTPWSGKFDYSTPKIVPLAGICFIERSKDNWIKECDTSKAIFNIFSQSTRRLVERKMDKMFGVLDEIFAKTTIYQLGCNISQEAVVTSYNAMKPKE